MTLRPCLHPRCAKLVKHGSYCANHIPYHQPLPRPHDERQTYAYQRARAQAIEDQPWCSECGATTNLQLGHRKRVADGGTLADGYDVVCATCNQRTNRVVSA